MAAQPTRLDRDGATNFNHVFDGANTTAAAPTRGTDAMPIPMPARVLPRLRDVLLRCSLPPKRWFLLGGIAGIAATAAGWFDANLPAQQSAEAFFVCRAVPRTDHGSEPHPLDPESLGELFDAAKTSAEATEPEYARVRLSMRHSRDEDGSHRVVVHAIDSDASRAQALCLLVARAIVSKMRESDPLSKACHELAQAEAAFQWADRSWNVARDRASAREEATPPDSAHPPTNSRAEQAASDAQPSTLIGQALTYCREQRERIAAVYTEQHPTVVHLDEQIRILAREKTTTALDRSSLTDGTANWPDPEPVGNSGAGEIMAASAIAEAPRHEDPAVMRARAAREEALAKLTLAQSRFESAAKSSPCLRYSEVSAGPSPIEQVGPHRQRWFFLLTTSALALLLAVEFLARRATSRVHPLQVPWAGGHIRASGRH